MPGRICGVTSLIDKLGSLLFPRFDWYERRMKTWRLVLSVGGAIVLVAFVAYVMVQVSESGFSFGKGGARTSLQDIGH